MGLFETDLPNGWRWEPLERNYRITKKPRALDVSAYERLPFVPMDAVPAGGAFSLRYESRSPTEIASGTYFERGDILLSKITPSFENGKQGKADDLPAEFGYGSTELIPLQPIDGASGSFLFFYLLHRDVRDALVARMEGSTGRQRVPDGAVRELLIPMPDSGEQARIARALQIARLAITTEERSIKATRDLMQTAMADLFARGSRGELRMETDVGLIPKSWAVVPMGALGRIGNGSTPKRTEPRYWKGGTHPWLTSGKIHERVITRADEFVTHAAIRECHLPIVPAGSLLIAITGQGKTLGNAALTKIDTSVSQHLAYCTIGRDDVDPQFVRLYLASRYEYLRGLGQAGGSTKGALTCAGLRMVNIPKPSLEEQREIARTLLLIEKKLDVLVRRRDTLNELFKSLLDDLMTGRRRVELLPELPSTGA